MSKPPYKPFGPEWEKELKKWTKAQLITALRLALESQKKEKP